MVPQNQASNPLILQDEHPNNMLAEQAYFAGQISL
jgi:hypothetical protein